LDTFKDTNGRCSKGAFSEIEFGFLPYSYENPNSDNSIPTPTDKYGNAKKVIDCFRNGGKTVYVTVYLSFHAPQNNNAGGIGDNAKNFNDNFLRQYFNLARISICPSLEDLDTDASQFPVWANLVASKIDSNLIGRVTLQRSPNGGITATMPSSNCFNERCFATEKRTEYHGKFNSNGTIYSNDGAFVYYEVPIANGNVESSSSLISNNTYDSYSFSNFLNGANSADNIVLLWRPAYNVLRRYVQNHQVFFTRDGRKNPDGTINDSQVSINSTEKNVLKGFLGVCGNIWYNMELKKGQSISSCNGDVTLNFQTDGNVVLSNNLTARVLWHTATGGRTDATRFLMQSDGNLVLYANNVPLWYSATAPNQKAYLEVQDDHNLVIYSSSRTPLWNTGTTNQ
jgi:hypothetical protein